ncbi:MAG: hypothetical protein KAZ14_03380 [Nitrosomonas sp.]|nr:hypothetical protein [Nitrosomonas sp.]
MAELFEVKDLKDFTPTTGLLKKILGVRVDRPSTSRQHPGLLSISNYSTDQKNAFLGFLAELIGLAFLIYYGYVVRRFPLIAVILAALFLFAADIVLLKLHHNFLVVKNKLLEFENALYQSSTIIPPDQHKVKENIDSIEKNKFWSRFFAVLLIAIAMLKVYGVSYFVPIGRNGDVPFHIYIALFILYMGAASAHIMSTGYALAGRSATKEFNKELSAYSKAKKLPENVRSKTDQVPLADYDIYSKLDIQSLDGTWHKINIDPDQKEPGHSKYYLERVGLLLDKHISAWATKTRDSQGAGYSLTESAMLLQLRMFDGIQK